MTTIQENRDLAKKWNEKLSKGRERSGKKIFMKLVHV